MYITLPNLPMTQAVTKRATLNSIEISWDPVQGAESCIFLYIAHNKINIKDIVERKEESTWVKSEYDEDDCMATFENLTPNTEYHFRIQAISFDDSLNSKKVTTSVYTAKVIFLSLINNNM